MRQTGSTPSRRSLVGASLGFALVAQAVPAHGQNRSPQMETTIRADSGVTTLVNVFTVEPDNQQKLVELLKEGTASFFSRMPGFISSSVHRSKDGRRAVNYAQWRSVRDIEAFREDPNFAPYIQRITALAKSESILCDVVDVNRA
jgi:heme-degrading monooxygenase HmoA